MKVFKYNTSLDKNVQEHNCYDAFIQLSEDGEQLLITNKKPVKAEYILEADPEEAQKKIEEIKI